MRIPKVRRTYRNLVRIKEILQVFTKYGFGHIVTRLNLKMYIPSLKYLGISTELPSYLTEESVPVRFRLVLQELGPAFVKFGQILSGRPDIIPENVIRELKILQDRVAPFSIDKVREILKNELEVPVEQIFPEFQNEVLASGSIGQVHEAILADGTEVIVKLKRPDIDRLITTDMTILRFFAELIEKYIEELRIFQPLMIVEEFERTIRRELDFTAEVSYTEQFNLLLKDNPNVSSPQVYWQYTSPNMITLERLNGINIGAIPALQQKNIDLKKLAQHLTSSFTQQYFVWGYFHADPHPGNILVSPEGKIFLVDFGMVGHLSEELKNQLATTLLALMRGDLDMIVETYADIGAFPDNINRRELKNDILELIDKYLHIPFRHLDMASIFENIVRLARSHQIMLPRDFVLLGKSMVTITDIVRTLDSDFNFMKGIAPNISAILKEKLSPKKLMQSSIFYLWSLMSLVQRLPLDIKELLRLLKKGRMRFILNHQGLEESIKELHKIANRLSVSMVLSALIIASALLSAAHVGPYFQNMPVLGVLGFALAFFYMLMLIVTNLRS